jgi:ketosteroid isomerase-like protein
MRNFVFVVLAACLVASVTAKSPFEIVDAANKKWMAYYNSGDIAGMAALYTPDAIAYPPGSNGTTAAGRAAVQNVFQGMLHHIHKFWVLKNHLIDTFG